MYLKNHIPMQLSLVDEFPEFNKVFFLDVFVESYFDEKLKKIRLHTVDGQNLPIEMNVSCRAKIIKNFPKGTVFKIDARLVRRYNQKTPYFMALKQNKIQRAIEYFDHNLKIQREIIED